MSGQWPIRVLLVEDSAADAGLVRDALAMAAHPFAVPLHVTRLSEAFEFLSAAEPPPPDAAVLDLGLPDSQGEETLSALHAAYPFLPIVVLTGLDEEDIGVRTLELGAEDYLPKARLAPQVLCRVLRYAIARKRCAEAERRQRLAERALIELHGEIERTLGRTARHVDTLRRQSESYLNGGQADGSDSSPGGRD